MVGVTAASGSTTSSCITELVAKRSHGDFPVATYDRFESDRPNHQSPITPWLGMRNEKRVISLSEEAVSQPWCALAISEAI